MTLTNITWWSDELKVIQSKVPHFLYQEIEFHVNAIREHIQKHNQAYASYDVTQLVSSSVFISVYEKAQYAHGLQRRKFTDKPYIEHPYKLALWYYALYGDDIGACALLCHDVLEDCPLDRYNVVELANVLGDAGYNTVLLLTDVSGVTRKQKKNALYQRLLDYKIPRFHKGKWLDSIDNMVGITLCDPVFGMKYLEEKKELFPYLDLTPEEQLLWHTIVIHLEKILDIYFSNDITLSHDAHLSFFERLTHG